MHEELTQLLQSDVSSADLFEWASAEVRRGVKPGSLVVALQQAGWAPQLAAYFTQQIEYASRGELRRKAAFVAATGAAWLALGIAGILAGHQLGGTWSTQGPLLVGWGVIACGAMRLVGGAAKAVRLGQRGGTGSGDQATGVQPSVQMDRRTQTDLHVLGLAPGATLETAHQAYKARAKLWHPDRFDAASELKPHAEKRMKLFNAAYARVREQLER